MSSSGQNMALKRQIRVTNTTKWFRGVKVSFHFSKVNITDPSNLFRRVKKIIPRAGRDILEKTLPLHLALTLSPTRTGTSLASPPATTSSLRQHLSTFASLLAYSDLLAVIGIEP
jgi:hypothetical protein